MTVVTVRADIMAVDDNPRNLSLLSDLLQDTGYRVRAARSGKLALTAARLAPPDLFLVDINMPEMDGFELCRRLKEDPVHEDTPVIFVTASDQVFDKVMAFAVGGVDYITKPFQVEEMVARIETHLKIDRQRREIEALRMKENNYYRAISEMKDRVLQITTHDLKNPLFVINLHVSVLRTLIGENEQANQSLDEIKAMSETMLQLISSTLDIARMEADIPVRRESVQINWFTNDLLSRFDAPIRRKQLDLIVEPVAEEMNVLLDRKLFASIVENLVSNAIKYTPPGGTLTVALDVIDNGLTLLVSDTGIGIPDEELSHIFERFYRVDTGVDRQESGSGLGLAIVKMIIDRLGGSISVQSQSDEGTSVTVCIPESSQDSPESETG